jgi:hypothetical protein
MIVRIALAFGALLCSAVAAQAGPTDCVQQPLSTTLSSLADNVAAGAITPGTLRNGYCSTLQIQIPMGQIYVGNSSGVGVVVTPSGDLTMSPLGAFTVSKTGGVAFGPLATQAGGSASAAIIAGLSYTPLAPNGSGASLTGLLWPQIGSTPTTLGGYGITDAYPATNPSNYIPASGAPVQSVAGRAGAVVLSAGDVSGLAPSATTDTTNAANITSGMVAAARLPGTGSTVRAPTQVDDSTAGYAAGANWLLPTGQLQTLLNNTAGKATWVPVATPLPLDAMTYTATVAGIAVGGTGYTTGQTATFANGTVLTVTATAGVVTAVAITNAGNWGCNTPSSPMPQVSSSGAGTGLTVNFTVPRFAAYGVAQLTKCYTTNSAYDVSLVLNGATTVKTIGFVGGVADQQAAASFCAASPSTCYVTKKYDQGGSNGFSSAGYDAIQATVANAPIFWQQTKIGNFNPIVFNAQQWATGTVAASAKWLAAPTYPWQLNESNLFVAGQSLNTRTTDIYAEEPASTRSFGTYFPSGVMAYNGAGVLCTGVTAETEPAVLTYSSQFGFSGTHPVCGSNNNQGSPSSYLSVATAFTGFNIGSKLDSISGSANWDGLAEIFGNFKLTAAQILAIQQSLSATFQIAPQHNVAVVVDGDSLLPGRGSLQNNSQTKLAQSQFKYPVALYNVSLSGATCGSSTTNFTAGGPATIYQSTYQRFIVVNDVFANDIRAAASAATIQACIQAYVNSVHALGSNARVVWAIPMEQYDIFASGPEFAVYQTIVNWLITQGTASQASGGAGADGIVSFWSDPTIGPGNFTTTPPFIQAGSIYSPDGLHPTDLSMTIMTPYLATGINALLP